MLTGLAAILMDRALVAEPEPVSAALTVKLAFPAAVGVPEIWPDRLKIQPRW